MLQNKQEMKKKRGTKERGSMFGDGCVQTLCNLYTFVFFMVFFLHCSFAFRVEKGHVELLLAHP
jgi:hypothetical protein